MQQLPSNVLTGGNTPANPARTFPRTVRRGPRTSVAFVSTYAPTTCGLATFTASLRAAVAEQRRSPTGLTVIRLVDEPTDDHRDDPSVREHRRGDGAALAATAAAINRHDAVSIQHEFGIFGGADGDEVTDLIDAIRIPTLTHLHTVLRQPTERQRRILSHVATRSSRSIVMSVAAASRLTAHYNVRPERITVLPHGFDPRLSSTYIPATGRPLALTWGLIGPGKGLETAIEAFAGCTDLDPLPRYRIAGATHPGVVAHSGETYREGLMDLVAELGLTDVVEFDDRYLDRTTLRNQIQQAHLIVLPYVSTEQVTSGVLTEAIGAGKPVVATAFPHAIEALASGAGIVVPPENPGEMAAAIRTICSSPATAADMARIARELAHGWGWPRIGARFDAVVDAVVHPRADRRARAVPSSVGPTGG